MLKMVFFLVLITQSVFGAKLTLDDRRKKILLIVDEELSEVSRLAKQQDYRYPDTLLRLSELNLEKARLYREAENEQYLSIPPDERRGISRNDYFKISSKFFDDANDAALLVVKKYPKYNSITDVYYILAYNYKELGKHELAQKYFKLSSQGPSSSSKGINLKAKLNLADYYYNDHKYKEAIPLYEASINQLNEKWWTKDSFNLAWSYYRIKNYGKAVSLMREVHRRSSDPKYLDVKSNVERDLGIFYIDAGQMNEAIKFYESLGLNYTEQFVKIANTIVTQGRFAQAESLLDQAEKFENNREKRVEILIAQLNLYDKFNKITEHLKVSKELVELHKQSPLSLDHFAKLNFHVNKKAAELQKTTASETYKTVPKVQKQKSAAAIEYFGLASILTPGQKAEKVFFQGETAYASGEFGKAIRIYLTAFDDAKTKNDKKIMNQSLEGMLSSLGKSDLDQMKADSYYIPVYTRYLSYDSKSERANQIHIKLFNVQFDSNDIPAAEATMASFAKNFPKDFKTQEGMLAKIMDSYRKKKNYTVVKNYVDKINEGQFKVSSKYADALRTLMTKIQIEGVQQSLEKGEKGVALRGYHQIYESSESTPKAKSNAAYNIAALYYELGDTTQSYQWSVIAVKEMGNSDVVKFADSFLSMASGLFLKQQFAQSADLSHRILAKLCRENSTNKAIAFKNSVFIALANNEIDKAIDIKRSAKSCSIQDPVIAEVSFEILRDLSRDKRWETFEDILKELELNSKNYPFLIKPYEDLRKQFVAIGNSDEAQIISEKQRKFYAQSLSQKLEIPVEALDLIAEKMLSGLLEKKQKLDEIALNFPEVVFNAVIKSKLQILDQLTTEVISIQKIGSGKGIVEAYRYVIDAYESFGLLLKNFTPEGKEQAYIDSFKKAMTDVHGPILQNAKKQRGEIKKLIAENKILSISNYSVLYSDLESFKRYITEKESVLMERGGRR